MANSYIQDKVIRFKVAYAALFEDGWTDEHPRLIAFQTPDEEISKDGAGIFRRFDKLIVRSRYGGCTYREFASTDDAGAVMGAANILP
jgi:hypothetical protein